MCYFRVPFVYVSATDNLAKSTAVYTNYGDKLITNYTVVNILRTTNSTSATNNFRPLELSYFRTSWLSSDK